MTRIRAANAAALPAPTNIDPTADFPDIYGMSVNGNCMAPEIPHGCNVKVSKTEVYGRGDIVCIWARPELIRPGGLPCMIKRVAMMPMPGTTFPHNDHPSSDVLAVMMLESNDLPGQWLRVRCSAIAAIHKVLGILTPEETGADFREQATEDLLKIERKRKRLATSRLKRAS